MTPDRLSVQMQSRCTFYSSLIRIFFVDSWRHWTFLKLRLRKKREIGAKFLNNAKSSSIIRAFLSCVTSTNVALNFPWSSICNRIYCRWNSEVFHMPFSDVNGDWKTTRNVVRTNCTCTWDLKWKSIINKKFHKKKHSWKVNDTDYRIFRGDGIPSLWWP